MTPEEFDKRQALLDRVVRAYSLPVGVHLKPLMFLVGLVSLDELETAVTRLEKLKLEEWEATHIYYCDSCFAQGVTFPYGTGPRFPRIGDVCTGCGHVYTQEEHDAMMERHDVEIIYGDTGWPIAKRMVSRDES